MIGKLNLRHGEVRDLDALAVEDEIELAAGIAALMFLWPPLATKLFPLILAADAAELALLLWLLVKGVDNSKWRALSA